MWLPSGLCRDGKRLGAVPQPPLPSVEKVMVPSPSSLTYSPLPPSRRDGKEEDDDWPDIARDGHTGRSSSGTDGD